MGFFVAPHRHAAFRDEIGAIMKRVKASLDDALPFAMDPVVYDFRLNPNGTYAELKTGAEASMPPRYYTLQVPRMIAAGSEALDPLRKAQGWSAAFFFHLAPALRDFYGPHPRQE